MILRYSIVIVKRYITQNVLINGLDEQDACPMCRKSTSSNERTSLIQYDSPIEEVESNVCSIVGLAVVLIIILIMVIVFFKNF